MRIQQVLNCDESQRGRSPPVDVKEIVKSLVGIVVNLAAYKLYIAVFPCIYGLRLLGRPFQLLCIPREPVLVDGKMKNDRQTPEISFSIIQGSKDPLITASVHVECGA